MRNSSEEDLQSVILDDFINDDNDNNNNNKTNIYNSYSISGCFINFLLCCFISLN